MKDPRFTVKTDETFKLKVQMKALSKGTTVSAVIIKLLEGWLKK